MALLGQAQLGVTVNAANGNLVLSSQDELLIGRGPDDAIVNTYNSQGTFTADGWQENYQRHVSGLTGTVNTSGSTITRFADDGAATVYTYDSSKALYVGNEGGGAYDTLSFGSNQWTWTEGKSRIVEIYDNTNSGRLYSTRDADGNTLTYTYTGALLTQITTANGDYTTLGYTGTLLTSVVTGYTDSGGTAQTQTRVRYGYDSSSRLQTVTVDLSPADNAVADNDTYVTTYGYDGTSDRINAITQSDGTSLQIGYTQVGSVYKVASLTQLLTSNTTTNTQTYATTSFDYTVAGQTTVTDALGNLTTLTYDSKGQLTRLTEPSGTPNGAAQSTSFVYDGSGNLLYSGPSSDPMFSNLAQDWGDLVTSSSSVATTQSRSVDGGVAVYTRQTTTTTPPSGWDMRMGQSRSAWTPVNAGQTVQFSVRTASTGASQIRLIAMWRDASGTLVSTSYTTAPTGGTIGAGGVSGAVPASYSAVAPAGAVYFELNVQAYADGTGPLDVAVAEPMISVDGSGQVPSYAYTYDASGNLLTKTDSLGNQAVFVYDAQNQLLTKTTSAAAGTSQTTRYVYDSESHLIYILSPLGEVTHYGYNSSGQQTSTIEYTMASDLYNLSGLSASASPSEADMTSWAGLTHDLLRTRRTDMTYDARGALKTVKTYARTNSVGTGNTSTVEEIDYVYGTAGELLSRKLADGTETYLYDGLLRMESQQDAYGLTTLTHFNLPTASVSDGRVTRTTVTTLANGTTRTSIYDMAGELIRSVDSGTGGGVTLTATTRYAYDLNGNLTKVTDPTNRSSYRVYDDRNRKVADVAADGSVVAYTYNENDQVVATTAYATLLDSTKFSALSTEPPAAPVGLADVTPATDAAHDRWSWNVYDAAGRLVEAIDANGYATAYAYDGADHLVATTQYYNVLSPATLAGFKTAAPLMPVLPAADASDRTTRIFYDDDGRVAGVLDADGYLTRTVYDDTGLKIRTIAYNTPAGTLPDPLGSVGTSADDIYNWFVYDDAGHLSATIDGEGNTVHYDNYNDMGFAGKVTRGQVLDPATLIATPPKYTVTAPTGTLEVTTYDYDEYGHVRSKTLTLNGGATETTTYRYDSLYNLVSESTASATAADGTADARMVTYKYDVLGRKIASMGGIGSAALAAAGTNSTAIASAWATYGTQYSYDLAGRLVAQTDPDSDTTLFYYDGNGRLKYQVGPDGEVSQYGYDVFGEQSDVTRYASFISTSGLLGGDITTALTDAVAAIAASATNTHTDYDLTGEVTDTVDALNATTTYDYDPFGDVKTVYDPLLVKTARTYSGRGLLLTSTVDSGATGHLALKTSYLYDAFGRIITVTDPNNVVRSTTYFRTGNVKAQVDGNTQTASFTYDAFGHLLSATDRDSKVTAYAYTPFDRQVTVTDPTQMSVTTTSNAYGQTVKTANGNGNTTAAYDADGNLVKVTDALSQVTLRNVYDAADRLIFSIDGTGAVTKYDYDKAGDVVETTQYTAFYTATGVPALTDMNTWVTSNSATGSVSTRSAFDGEGRAVYTIARNNLLTRFYYDGDGRVTQQVRYAKVYAAAGTVSQATLDGWVRPDAGNADPTKDIVTRFAYDADGRLAYSLGGTVYTSDTPPAGAALLTRYSYDAAGNLSQQTQYAKPYTATGIKSTTDLDGWIGTTGNVTAADRTTRYLYDKLGRVIYTADAAGTVTNITYDNEGRVLQTIVFSDRNDPASDILTWVGGRTGATTRYVYDAEGRKLYEADPAGTVTGYIYDDAGRLVQTTTYADAMPAGTTDIAGWTSTKTGLTMRSVYDDAHGGNLAYTIDAVGAVTGYIYDANGAVTQKVAYAAQDTSTGPRLLADMSIAAGADDRTTSYTHDANGNLTSVTDALGYVTRYTYDAYGYLAFVIDPAGDVTGYTYTSAGQVTKTTRYAAANTSTGIQSLGQMQSWVTANANAGNDISTQAAYDAFGRATTTTDGNGYVTSNTYDAEGRLSTTMTAANTAAGLKTTYVYDTFGDLAQITDPLGGSGFFYYDRAGRQILQVDAEGYATGTEYYASGQVKSVTRYYNRTSGASLTHMPTSLADSGGRDDKTSFLRDGDGRVTGSTDGNGYVTSYTYDTSGNRKTMTNAATGVISYTYDGHGLLTTQTSPAITLADGSTVTPVTTYSYNIFGDLQTMTEGQIVSGGSTPAALRTTSYVHDKDGRLTQQSGDAVQVVSDYDASQTTTITPTQNFIYDSRGNQIASQDANGGITLTYYDNFDRKIAQVDAAGALTAWTYDKSGNVTAQKVYGDLLPLPTDPNGAIAQIYRMYDIGRGLTPTASNIDFWLSKLADHAANTQPSAENWQDDVAGNPADPDGERLGALEGMYTDALSFSSISSYLHATADANTFITAVFQAAFGRAPTSTELSTWTTNLSSGGWTRAGMVMRLSEQADHRAVVNPIILQAISGTTAPTPVNASNYRETDYVYDKDNRLTSTSVLGVTTGSWTSAGGWTADTTTTVSTSNLYDADGNLIRQTDGNGNNTYTWYDALGRKVAEADAGKYLTAYTLDAEGNVLLQTQYANAYTGTFTAGGAAPTPATGDDRKTAYTYDHDGQRLSETRQNVAYYHYDPLDPSAPPTSTTGDVTVNFTYNGLGQVTQKTEATGDSTVYAYDSLGRVTKVTTASGADNALATDSSYDALGNLTQTVAYRAAGAPTDSNAEKTVYTYGAGGRLSQKTDAQGFEINYGYDANGNTVRQGYARLTSTGDYVQEASLTGYDAMGRTIFTATARQDHVSGLWSLGDTTDTFYDAYGEVTARGTNTGRDIGKAQQYADYDAAGRVWRTNMEDGVAKVYGYDKNGNMTLQLQSLGTTNLRSAGTIGDAVAASGVSETFNLYDSRNELTDVKRPTSANLDGTIANGRTVAVGPKWTVTATFIDTPATTFGGDCTTTINVALSDADLSTSNGTGKIWVTVVDTNSGIPQTMSFDSGSTSCGSYSFDFPAPTAYNRFDTDPDDLPEPVENDYTVTVEQAPPDDPDGTRLHIATLIGSAIGRKGGATLTTTDVGGVGSELEFRGVDPSATALTLYVRQAGTTGNYAEASAAAMLDGNGDPIPGSFTFDTSLAPFLATASSSWEVCYRATDVHGHSVDTKGGTLTFDGGTPPAPTAANFVSIPVFTASASGALWHLTPRPLTFAYSDFTQTFDAFGDVTGQVDANGNGTTFAYDRLGNLTLKTGSWVAVVGEDGVSHQARPTDNYYYDISGRLIGHLDPNLNLMYQTLQAGTGYDGGEALVTAQYLPEGPSSLPDVSTTTYDVFGNAKTVTDATGAVTTNTYDKDNRLVSVAHAQRSSGDATYTASGPTQLIDSYVYDGLGQRIKHTNNVFTGYAETTDYDSEGRVTRTGTFGGEVTTYAYTWTAGTATSRVTAGQTGAGAWTRTTTASGKTSTATTDTFGTLLTTQDFGGNAAAYTYNLDGQITEQKGSGSNTQWIDYTYTTSGQVASVTDKATGMQSFYAYDANGNRTVEGYDRLGTTATYYQNEVITYDALNRVTEIHDDKADITYSYDANGNRREVKSVYDNLGIDAYGHAMTSTQDYWYKYDGQNRFVVSEGTLSGDDIVAGSTGVVIAYNARGDRMSAAYGSDGHVEHYTYSNDGVLETVSVATVSGGVLGTAKLGATRKTDVLGRLTFDTEYQADGATTLSTRAIAYDRDNRITNETDQTQSSSGGSPVIYSSVITNSYVQAGVDIGVLASSVNQQYQTGVTDPVTTTTTYAYAWWNQAKETAVTVTGTDPDNGNTSQWLPGNATYRYDADGNLTQVVDGASNGVHRTVDYITDAYGQVLFRQETDYSVAMAQRTFFYLNGRVVGDVGNDQLDSRVDYAQALAQDRADAATAGDAMHVDTPATAIVGVNGDFDTSYQAYNPTTVAQSGQSYTARAGDTLQSVALAVWGDASLWYVLADANGLDAGTVLAQGQMLSVPGNVTVAHNASSVFRPYDPNDALGNTDPTLPKEPQPPAPKQHGCGLVGDVLAVIVAAVVLVVTKNLDIASHVLKGALMLSASDAASQLTEIAVGNQSKFNWTEVAAAAITGGIEGKTGLLKAMAKPDLPGAVIRSLQSNAIRQAVDISLGLQKKFDWAGLAVSGVVGAAAYGLAKVDWGGHPRVGMVVTGVAADLAGAVTKSALTGQSLGKSVREVLPDAIGSTVGSFIGESMVSAWDAVPQPDPTRIKHYDGPEIESPPGVKQLPQEQITAPDYSSFPSVAADANSPMSYFEQMASGAISDSQDMTPVGNTGAYYSDDPLHYTPSYIEDSGSVRLANGGSVSWPDNQVGTHGLDLTFTTRDGVIIPGQISDPNLRFWPEEQGLGMGSPWSTSGDLRSHHLYITGWDTAEGDLLNADSYVPATIKPSENLALTDPFASFVPGPVQSDIQAFAANDLAYATRLLNISAVKRDPMETLFNGTLYHTVTAGNVERLEPVDTTVVVPYNWETSAGERRAEAANRSLNMASDTFGANFAVGGMAFHQSQQTQDALFGLGAASGGVLMGLSGMTGGAPAFTGANSPYLEPPTVEFEGISPSATEETRPIGIQFEGTVFRLENPSRVNTTFDAHAGNVAANHRYSGPGQGAVYGATSPETALAEIQYYGLSAGRVSVSKEVQLGNVLDLTNSATRRELGVTLRDITGNSYTHTQRIGDWARVNGYDGIIAPSARNASGTNLIIFPGGK